MNPPLKTSTKSKKTQSALALPALIFFLSLASSPSWGIKASAVNQSEIPGAATTTPNRSLVQNEIIFASLSGSAPKYIDSGPDRGLGWLEYMTHDIRRGMQSDGFSLKQEWMTPARIAHEFQTITPICSYPVRWNQSSLALKDQNKVLSIALNLEGEDAQSIAINRGDAPKFKKHLDTKGDLNLYSLLKDPSLKTMLVRDQDYGLLTDFLTTRDKNGEQIVRPEYQSHVELRVINSNLQVLEMLHAHRFDYTLSEAIEAESLKKAGINPFDLAHINYQSERITAIDSPELIQHSIGCSKTPLTIAAMPYFNKWILKTRNMNWINRQLNYRAQIDPQFRKTSNIFWNTTVGRFMDGFFTGKGDTWFALQRKGIPSLRLFPKEALETEPLVAPKLPKAFTKTSSWLALELIAGELVLLKEGEYDALLNSEGNASGSPYSPSARPSLASILNLPQPLARNPQALEKSMRLENLTSLRKKWKGLTLFASFLKSEDIPILLQVLAPLEKLALTDASAPISDQLLKQLPPSLTQLILNTSELSKTPIASLIGSLQRLETLKLESVHLPPEEFAALLRTIPSQLKQLSLSHNPTSWSPEAATNLSLQRFKNLISLDLSFSHQGDSIFTSALSRLPDSLEEILLNGNFLSPKGVYELLSGHHPRLKRLELAGSAFSPKAAQRLNNLPSLEQIDLSNSSLRSNTLSQWIPRSPIRRLKLTSDWEAGHNDLQGQDVSRLFPFLASEVKELQLSRIRLAKTEIQALIDSKQIKHIQRLELRAASLSNSEASTLAQAGFSVDDLNLRRNQIRDQGASTLAANWHATLKRLNLSDNLIGREGLRAVSRKLPKDLKALNLSANLDIDSATLAEHLPNALEELNLSELLLNDSDLAVLGPRLPPSLNSLDLEQSVLGNKGINALTRAQLPRLASLNLFNTTLSDPQLNSLCAWLPNTLSSLNLSDIQTKGAEESCLGALRQLPLKKLFLTRFGSSDSALAAWMQNLPKSLQTLELSESPFSTLSALALSKNWPPVLRLFETGGLHLGIKGMAILSRGFPESIENLTLQHNETGDEGASHFFQNKLPYVFRIVIDENELRAKAVRSLEQFERKFTLLSIDACGLNDQHFSHLTKRSLGQVKDLYAGNNPTTPKGVLHLIKTLSPDLYLLSIASAGLNYRSTSTLLQSLPIALQQLVITGNPVGEKGLQQVGAFAKDREARTGLPLEVVE